MNPTFERYIGIDYSGAQTPKSSLKGMRVYAADRLTTPQEIMPPPSPRKYWTRRGIAERLVARLSEGQPMLVGIDHGFSFTLRYFEQHGLPLNWSLFLDDFQRHWPTDEDIYVDFVRDGSSGNGTDRSGNPRWRRVRDGFSECYSPFPHWRSLSQEFTMFFQILQRPSLDVELKQPISSLVLLAPSLFGLP
jgi:hypothetical protein